MKPRTRIVVVMLIALAGLSPILCAMGAGAIASARGCELNEGAVHPCVILGHDFGELLYGMGVLGWASLVTMPAATCVLSLWALIALLRWGARRLGVRRS